MLAPTAHCPENYSDKSLTTYSCSEIIPTVILCKTPSHTRMPFDFSSFLHKLDPSTEYEFQSLSGGLVNLTQRATKTSPLGAGKFPAQASLILKYAPPFIAALGEEAPFSQKRQVWNPLTVESCRELNVKRMSKRIQFLCSHSQKGLSQS